MTRQTMSDGPSDNGRQVAISESGNPCAWCLKEHGIKPKATDSHGCCPRHAAEVRAEIAANKVTRYLAGVCRESYGRGEHGQVR